MIQSLSEQVTTWLTELFRTPTTCELIKLGRSRGSEIHRVSARNCERNYDLILRRVVMADWIRREPDLIDREATALGIIRTLHLPTPRLVAADPRGNRTGAPALLMTRVRGDPWPIGRWPTANVLTQLARWLRFLHEAEFEEAAIRKLPPYRPHHWPTITTVAPPAWTRMPEIWLQAASFVRCWHPVGSSARRLRLLHRDYRLENLLWNGDEAVGVVDWITACYGDASADVGHCRWNLCRSYGVGTMHSFSAAYGLTQYDPIWDLFAAVGGNPDTAPMNDEEVANLDAFVAAAVSPRAGTAA